MVSTKLGALMEYQVTMPFRGVSAADRRTDRRSRLVGSAFEIAGTEGAVALGVGRVCLAAGLTKRYFYESFGRSPNSRAPWWTMRSP